MREEGEPRNRCAVELPVGLLDHISVCIEEGLYSQGYSQLTNTLIAGTGTPRPAYVPPAQFFALAATLAVHPSMTTRTNTKDKQTAANDAIRYLSLAQKVVGTKNASLPEAFRFTRAEDMRAQRARFRKSTELEDKPVDKLQCVFVTERHSMWDRAEDFWQLLGWALNCSVVERKRWTRWHLLLSVMLNVLENDLQQAILDSTPDEPPSSQLPASALDDTLIVKYLRTASGVQNKRRVMRAIFADGTAKSLAEFGEVWENETAEPKQSARQKKRQKLDIDKGQYGDYDENSDDELIRTIPSLEPVKQLEPASNAYTFTDHEATAIRQRVLALVAKVCTTEPEAYISAQELFDLYADFMRPLPVSQFQDIAMASARLLDANSRSSLYQVLLRSSIDFTAPVYTRNDLTQEDFETHFAPYAANSSTFADNAKVSLVTEGMLRLLWKHGMLTATNELKAAITQGLQTRSEHAKTGEKDYDRQCLESSGERMLAVLKRLQENV